MINSIFRQQCYISPEELTFTTSLFKGLMNKSDELKHSFEIDGMNAHRLCLSKHHMVEQDLLHLTLDGYLLGSSFCRQNLQSGGVCIFVKKDQSTKLIFHNTVKNRIWKFVQFSQKQEHLT
jgi:hypothetical protein